MVNENGKVATTPVPAATPPAKATTSSKVPAETPPGKASPASNVPATTTTAKVRVLLI